MDMFLLIQLIGIISVLLNIVDPCVSTPCTFENSNICGYKQDKKDDFDWTRSTGETPSTDTGPDHDHTKKSDKGYYMHIETSSPRLQGDKARLVSLEQTSSSSDRCVTFWYHMYGQDTGTLNVYLQTNGITGKPVWRKKGEQGNAWRLGEFDIPAKSGRVSIVFEGIRGLGYRGDIALDDVDIKKGPCSPGSKKKSLSCDFESSNLCGYTEDKTDDFDWTRTSGTTPSPSTGPLNDHTVGSIAGHYIHIEASDPRQLGNKARLISPVSLPAEEGCLQFWYHMYGSHIGTLNVYVKSNGLLGIAVWSKKGNKGNGWIRGEFPLTKISGNFQIVFEGMRGTGYQGDIAIDDVKFMTDSCARKSSVNCDFESSDICQFEQDSSDDFDWTRQTGETSSVDTGPTNDHTYKMENKGFFMFIETSSPRATGDIARLMTPEQPSPSSDLCVQFWYHMYGQTISKLNVYLKQKKNLGNSIWSKTGDQGKKWLLGEIEVPANFGAFHIVFEGVVGSDYHGDIAIDDIHMKQGGCYSGKSGNCTFESGLCSWTNAVGSNDDFDWSVGMGGTQRKDASPFVDHTYHNKTGKYLYTECSPPQSLGNIASIRSTRLAPTNGTCVSFWYHMDEDSIGKLSVSVHVKGSRSPVIWELKGRQGQKWKLGQISVASALHYRILINVTCSKGLKGNIGIDDVTIDNTQSCSVLPKKAVKEWHLVFLGKSGNGDSIYDKWRKQTPSLCTISKNCLPENEDISIFNVKSKHHLKSPIIDNWSTSNIKQVKLELYKKKVLVMSMIFDGTNTNNINWFSSKNLINNSFDDLYGDGCFFKYQLNSWYAYSFMTFQDGHPCDTYAKGWFAVIDKEYSSSSSYPSTCLHMKQQQYPVFAYAEYNHKTKWVDKSFGLADTLAIMVKRI
ncbi:MAM and LDL-receptor class A domain-containing protein 1-like isoform X1 [Mytilus galloprovincialis]|uniref:MAM and LDL-receptor class A domain-containing protein 1-like isoform X1 n=2 Tax=Mytilus galloprovincialis TaxID=29158 RepID=UPI003F7CAF84